MPGLFDDTISLFDDWRMNSYENQYNSMRERLLKSNPDATPEQIDATIGGMMRQRGQNTKERNASMMKMGQQSYQQAPNASQMVQPMQNLMSMSTQNFNQQQDPIQKRTGNQYLQGLFGGL